MNEASTAPITAPNNCVLFKMARKNAHGETSMSVFSAGLNKGTLLHQRGCNLADIKVMQRV